MFARPTLLLLTATAAVSLSACGSSDSSSGSSGGSSASASSGPFTRAQLAAKADAICANAKTASHAIVQPTSLTASPAKSATFFEQVGVVVRNEANQLAALKPDSEAKADWNAMVAGQLQLANLTDDIAKKVKARNTAGLTELQSPAARGTAFTAAATKIGAKGCVAAG
jgi:hypothetical protein